MKSNQKIRLKRTHRGAVVLGALGLLAFGASASAQEQPRDPQQGDVPVQPRAPQQEARDRGEEPRDVVHQPGHTEAGHQAQLDEASAIDVLSTIHQGEIELARFAREHADDRRVRAFAAQLIRHHTQAQSRLNRFARTASITPATNDVSARLRSEVQATQARLTSLSGEEFDRAFLESQASMHQTALDTIDNRIMPAAEENAGFVRVVRRTRTTVEDHRNRATELEGMIGAPPPATPQPTTPRPTTPQPSAPQPTTPRPTTPMPSPQAPSPQAPSPQAPSPQSPR